MTLAATAARESEAALRGARCSSLKSTAKLLRTPRKKKAARGSRGAIISAPRAPKYIISHKTPTRAELYLARSAPLSDFVDTDQDDGGSFLLPRARPLPVISRYLRLIGTSAASLTDCAASGFLRRSFFVVRLWVMRFSRVLVGENCSYT